MNLMGKHFRNLKKNEPFKDGEKGFATLAAVNQHMTYHIETKIEYINDQSDKDITLESFLNLEKTGLRIIGNLEAMDKTLVQMKGKQETLLKMLGDIKQIQTNNCKDRECFCDPDKLLIWDNDIKKCICDADKNLIWDDASDACICDPNKLLEWDGETCACNKDKDLIWDSDLDTCVCDPDKLLDWDGQACSCDASKDLVWDETSDSCICDPDKLLQWDSVNEVCICIPDVGLEPDDEGICKCDAENNFVWDEENCVCDADKGLIDDGQGGCKCPEDTPVFDPIEGCKGCDEGEMVHNGECMLCKDVDPELEWDADLQKCVHPAQYVTETVLLIGGKNFDKIYEQRTDAALFCPEDDGFVREIQDVIDDQSGLYNLISHTTSVLEDVPKNFTKLIFGGNGGSRRLALTIFEKERVGNNQGLGLMSVVDMLVETEPDKWTHEKAVESWTIPTSYTCKGDETGDDCAEEVGKHSHQGVNCLIGPHCKGRNFLIGGKTAVTGRMSRSVLEWEPVEGFLNMDENQIVHESHPENQKLFMKVSRASFGAVATSAKNKICQGIFVMGGQTDSDPSDITRAVYTNTVECFNGATGTWEELEKYKFPFMENGLESFAMVAVRGEQHEDIYVTGGLKRLSNGQSIETDRIYSLKLNETSNEYEWIWAGVLNQARQGHVAWVSYGLRPEQGDQNGDFDFPMVFSAGGIGPLNGDVRERRLEYFDIADDASHAPYGMQAAYDDRTEFAVMVFGYGQFDNTLLPSYEEHCANLETLF